MKLINTVALLLSESVSAQTVQNTASNYNQQINQQVLALQNNCKTNDSSNSAIQNGDQQPACFGGFNLQTDFNMVTSPPYNKNVQQINSVACGQGQDRRGTWCPSAPQTGRRSCAVKGSQVRETNNSNLVIDCIGLHQCETFTFNGGQWTYNACPNLQCPAYTYRSGPDNQERYNGQLVFRQSGCSQSSDKSLNRNNCDQMRSVAEGGSSFYNLPGYYRSIIPFQCIHDQCSAAQGMFINKGNTDTGPVNQISGLKRQVIEPFWTPGINTHDPNASANQGRCSQCQSYEKSTLEQDILSYKWNQYDTGSGTLISSQSPSAVGRGRLGCSRCSDYEKRDRSTGQCRRHTCAYNEVLIRNGNRQGECQQCPAGEIPDSLGLNCRRCSGAQQIRTVTNAQGRQELTCGCDSRSFLNQFGECTRCQDYLCPPENGFANRCVVPFSNSNQIVRPDCSLETCQFGQTPDTQKQKCIGSAPVACPEWTRRQFDGNCNSDRCFQGQQLVRAGVNQGTCIQCPSGEQSTSTFRGCQRVLRCSANEVIQNGVCQPCGLNQQPDQSGTYCISVACPPYTRRQLNNQCQPDSCSPNSYNIQFQTFDSFGQQLEQGKCVPCSQGQVATVPDPRNYNARTGCTQKACSANEILTTSGVCQACTGCTTPDSRKQFCVQVQCYGNQILRRFGQSSGNQCGCESCTGKQVPNADRSACQTCPQDSYINQFGECVKCEKYPREAQSADGYSCVEKACGNRQFLNFNGDCQNCDAYQVSNGYQCYEPECGDRTIVNAKGLVENCPAYSRMVVDKDGKKCRTCGEDKCEKRQYLSSDGYCYDCQDFSIPDPTRRECITPTCPGNSVITKEGTCQACGRGKNPDATQTQCIDVQCGLRERIVEKGSETSCEPCPTKTRAQEENTVCKADPCDLSKRQYIREDGICEPCPAYQIVNEEKTQCVNPKCGVNEVVTQEGKCESCPTFQKRVDFGEQFGFGNRYQCQECACNSGLREFCLPNGECDTCGKFQVPTEDGKACRRPTCPQIVNEDGSCGNCEDWHYFDEDEKKCLPKVCDDRSRVTRDGQCSKCPTFFYVTENKRDCEQCDCKARETCQEDGTCKECPDYFIVATTGDKTGTCVKATCEDGVLQKDGTCQLCNQCEKLNEAKTKCVAPTCSQREVLSYDGKCVECEKFTGPQLLDGKKCGAVCQSCKPTGRQFLREDGECETCPDYNRISDDKRKCSVVPCTGNSIVTVDGYCFPCQDYTRADPQKRKCLPTQCLENEILKRDGECQACPKYQRSDPMGRYCMQSACNDAEYFDDKGYCQDCGPCSRSSLENLRLKCFADKCGANQILLSDGRCQNCQPYTKPSSTKESKGKCGQICKEVECAKNEIVLEDGSCQACPSWTMPQENARVCGPSICGAREKLLISGRCEECPDYTRGGGQMQKQQFSQCLSDKCEQNQKLTVDGTCAFCEPYEKADETGRKCLIPSCGERTHKLRPDATFEKCADYSRATENCRSCAPDPCNLRQKLLKNGKCQNCDPYMRATPDGKDCRLPVCEKNQILKEDGTCQDCPPFMKKGQNGKVCIKVTCSQTQRLLPIGECEDCESYSRAINDGKACAPNLCTQRERIDKDGTCKPCDEYTRATSDHKSCASQVCTARQILQKDGRCAECYPYTRADAAGKICVPHNCSDREKLGPDGSCVKCPEYERAQGTGLTCGPDQCNIRQRITREGTCVYCELYHAVCSNRRCCTKPTCKPSVEYITMDGVCGSCPFHQQTSDDGISCTTDPTKKLPDPQIMAPTPISLQSAPAPGTAPTAGYDVWTDEQFLSEDRATGFYLNQQTGNWGFILGTALRMSSAIAGLGAALLILSSEL